MRDQDGIRTMVREHYVHLAKKDKACCGAESDRGSSCCCARQERTLATGTPAGFSYSAKEVNAAPEGSFLGLGCGNPVALARLQAGETVLDLGSGGGFDCFLGAREVGPAGCVIGVDMTPEMVSRARANAELADARNVEFRLGEIENLPVADSSVDVIISNCVINLSPEKPLVFKEAFRVLKPGGRIIISDMIATAPMPERFRDDPDLYCRCISGAAEVGMIEAILMETGFSSVRIRFKDEGRRTTEREINAEKEYPPVSSAIIEARKLGNCED